MELAQLQLGSKVKLQLIQPYIKCSDRDTITCYYGGKIIGRSFHFIVIEFKYNKNIIQEKYYFPLNGKEGFLKEELQDIKII